MRSAGNFSPEWGYLAPAPSVLRTLRIVLVATAIGATAGAGVVLSLVDRPTGEADRVAVAEHAIVTTAEAAPVTVSPKVSTAAVVPSAISNAAAPTQMTAAVAIPQAQVPQAQAPQIQAAVTRPDNAAQPGNVTQPIAPPVERAPSAQAETASDSSPTQPAAVAALSDAATATAPDTPAVTSDATDGDAGFVGPQQPQKKKHHAATGYRDGFPDIGRTLRHLFSARNNGTSSYPNRAF